MLRYNLVTFLYFGVASILSTFYFPFLSQDVGLSLGEVSKAIAFGALFSLASQPYLSHLFAKSRNKKRFMIVYFGLLAIVNVAMLFVDEQRIYLFAILYGCLALPLIGTYEIYIEKISSARGYMYSKIRKWGSIGLGSVTLVGGSLIALAGFELLHAISLVFLAACAWIVYRKFETVEDSAERPKMNYRKALADKRVLVLFAMSFLGLGSYIGVDFAFSSYLTELTGSVTTSNQIFSVSTGVKVFLEFVTFTLLGLYFNRVDVKKAFVCVFVFSGLRFLFLSTGELPLVVLGDQFHGLAFPLFLVTVFRYLRSLVPDELVPSCYGIVSMLVFGVSNLAYPPLFAAIQNYGGYGAMYTTNFALSVAVIAIGIFGLPPGKRSRFVESSGETASG